MRKLTKKMNFPAASGNEFIPFLPLAD